MKKISLLCATIMTCLSLAACGNNASHKISNKVSPSTKVVKKHHKRHSKKKQSSSTDSSSVAAGVASNTQQTQTSNSVHQQQVQTPQGQINRQRGYDPSGAPVIPGQDHAPGATPDGTPDPWVQGQLDYYGQN